MAVLGARRCVWQRPFGWSAGAILANALLIYDVIGEPSIDLVNWTLSVELKFYLLAMLLLPWLRRGSAAALLAVAVTILAGNAADGGGPGRRHRRAAQHAQLHLQQPLGVPDVHADRRRLQLPSARLAFDRRPGRRWGRSCWGCSPKPGGWACSATSSRSSRSTTTWRSCCSHCCMPCAAGSGPTGCSTRWRRSASRSTSSTPCRVSLLRGLMAGAQLGYGLASGDHAAGAAGGVRPRSIVLVERPTIRTGRRLARAWTRRRRPAHHDRREERIILGRSASVSGSSAVMEAWLPRWCRITPAVGMVLEPGRRPGVSKCPKLRRTHSIRAGLDRRGVFSRIGAGAAGAVALGALAAGGLAASTTSGRSPDRHRRRHPQLRPQPRIHRGRVSTCAPSPARASPPPTPPAPARSATSSAAPRCRSAAPPSRPMRSA